MLNSSEQKNYYAIQVMNTVIYNIVLKLAQQLILHFHLLIFIRIGGSEFIWTYKQGQKVVHKNVS